VLIFSRQIALSLSPATAGGRPHELCRSYATVKADAYASPGRSCCNPVLKARRTQRVTERSRWRFHFRSPVARRAERDASSENVRVRRYSRYSHAHYNRRLNSKPQQAKRERRGTLGSCALVSFERSKRDRDWGRQRIDFTRDRCARYINYNLISRHVSVLTATSPPSGSILARASNSIKIEKLNCDDPIRATKRAPFLIRPRAPRWKIFRVCVYARRVKQCTFPRESGWEKGRDRGRKRETGKERERERELMCAVHAIRGCDSAVIITRGTLRGTTKCLRVLNNEEINKKPVRRGERSTARGPLVIQTRST